MEAGIADHVWSVRELLEAAWLGVFRSVRDRISPIFRSHNWAMQALVLGAVERACIRSANITTRKMKRRVNSLAVIACTAPSIGSLVMLDGTRIFIKDMGGCGYGDCAGGPSELFVLPAIGLLVASVAMLLHGILSAPVECFRVEMKSATLQLMNDLVRPSTNI